MPTDQRDRLAHIQRFDQLIVFLRDEMGWPIDSGDFEEMTFEYTPEELGIDKVNAAKIQQIKRLRPLATNQPWGIFFVKFEPRKLPVVALRRILSRVVLRKRASANPADRAAWSADDLLFISNFGEGEERQITFAHFSQDEKKSDLPTLKVLGWDDLDTSLHLDNVVDVLTTKLAWPTDSKDASAWRSTWRSAFTVSHGEVITTAKTLAIRLADLAKKIRKRILATLAVESDDGPLRKLQKAFREALIHDLDGDGFADMYAQTIAYGLLSARVTDPKANTADGFAGQLPVTNPFLKELMETFLHVGGRKGRSGKRGGLDFDELGVNEVVELLDRSKMDAVLRDFGDRNPQEDPVIHFYEGFAKVYDPIDKVRRGEFYTPRPVVSYIVCSVHELLRTEFGLADGLADTTTWGEMAKGHKDLKIPEGVSPDQDFVQILDPATGTGTFLVEAIDLIHKTLVAKWKSQEHNEDRIDALWNEYVPKHLLTRLYAYELKMAPYAISHLKIGLKLHETGYRFGSDERARIYLTNALEPASDESQMRLEGILPALAHEAKAVNTVKRKHRFTVIIGNPPYAGHSSNTGDWARALVDRYRRIDGRELRLAQGKWLQNDYVKFIALAETSLAQSDWGVWGFITDHSYLDGDTFPGLRYALLSRFSRIEVLNLHGSLTRRDAPPDGGADGNVFDIQQGVAISLGWRSTDTAGLGRLAVADLWGTRNSKFAVLCGADCRTKRVGWQVATTFDDRYLFVTTRDKAGAEDGYETFEAVDAIFSENGKPAPGFLTTHDGFAIAFSKKGITSNVETLLASKNEEDARSSFKLCSQEQWRYSAAKVALRRDEWRKEIRLCLYRPFDERWTVYDPHVLVHRRERVNSNLLETGNLALLTTRMTKGDDFRHVFVSDKITEVICLSSKTSANAFVFPLLLHDDRPTLPGVKSSVTKPNISARVLNAYRAAFGAAASPRALFMYCYAILYSPGYRQRYNDKLIREFPRIPRPVSAELFGALVDAGARLVSAHLLNGATEKSRLHGSGTGAVAPGMPKFDRRNGRININAAQYFHPVGRAVWDYRVGSYEVCKKWVSERREIGISSDDAMRFSQVLRAIETTLLVQKDVDELIDQHGGWPGAFTVPAAQEMAQPIAEPFALRAEPYQAPLYREKRPPPEALKIAEKVIPFERIHPKREERYKNCVPFLSLKAAAGGFSDDQAPEFEDWVEIKTSHPLKKGMFVAQVIGKSMEPLIPDGSYCLFRYPVLGPRKDRVVLVQSHEINDSETGGAYTVKRYRSEKSKDSNGTWHHSKIVLEPENPVFRPIVLTPDDEGEVKVVAEFIEVLSRE